MIKNITQNPISLLVIIIYSSFTIGAWGNVFNLINNSQFNFEFFLSIFFGVLFPVAIFIRIKSLTKK